MKHRPVASKNGGGIAKATKGLAKAMTSAFSKKGTHTYSPKRHVNNKLKN